MPPTEALARAELINPQLEQAGWNLSNRSMVRLEVPVTGYDPAPWNGFTDFSLYDAQGRVLAVVEAKRTSRSAREGEEQLRQYVTEIGRAQEFDPFGFLTNGLQTYFWDVGSAHPRPAAGFFTQGDLERLLFTRRNAQPLDAISIDNSIVDRPYQHEAIRAVSEAFTAGQRRALLVMATGTGKTRTTMGLIDVLMRASWAQRVLFVADRDALVEQALSDGFKAHLPHEPRVRIHTANIDTTRRLYVATLQTMGRAYPKFSPGFFDVIVFDEAHRSIFNRFNEVIEYFDARMVGLTATPAAFVSRDTFRVFGCRDQVPTFLYSYETAVREKRLVDFHVHQAQTGFQRKGIRGVDLSEEDRNALLEQGIDPDDLDYSGTDIEVEVSNRDTLRRQWEELLDVAIKDQSGTLPGKTIIFAMTKKHAARVRDVFEEMFPQHVGVVQVVYNGMERVHDGPYGDGLISQFRKNDKPRIAISVDMLDTGIDVPEVVNLVFMKPVQSSIKLWQMIGRGTRPHDVCRYLDRLPGGKKTEFLITDFWQNDFGARAPDRGQAELPLPVRLFNTRLAIVEATLQDQEGFAHRQAIEDCRRMLETIPTDSFLVRKVWADVESAWKNDFWFRLTKQKCDFLRLKVGPLLRYVPHVDAAAETFTHKVERLKLQTLQNSTSAVLAESIADDVELLPPYVLKDERRKGSIQLALSGRLVTATPEELTRLVADVASDMRNKRQTASTFLHLDLPDFIAGQTDVIVDASGQTVNVEEYRRRVELRIVELVESHPAMAALREGREPGLAQLVDLERVLHADLESSLGVSEKTMRQAYGLKLDQRVGFLGLARHVLDLDGLPDYEAVVARAFQDYITAHNYSGDQIRFLRAVQDVFLGSRRIGEAQLYEPPLTNFGRNAVARYFDQAEINKIVALAEGLKA